MLPEYTPGANLYDYAFYGPMQTDDNAMLSSFQVGGMPWGQQQQQQQQGGGGDDEIMQYIQMYSEITESDPEEVMSQISSMSQEDQQAALQEMVGTVQKYYTMQQSRQQNQMVDEQQQSMYDEEDESAQPAQYQKSYNTPTPEELAGLEAEEEQYNAAVEAATADYGEEEYMYGGSKRGRNKFTSQLKKAARGMAQEMVNTDGLPTGNSSYGGERLKKFVAGIQRNVANTMADEAVEQSMDYFSQPSMMRYGGLPTFQGTQNSETGNTSNTGNISLTPEQFNQLLAAQNRGSTPQYPGMGRSVNMSNLLSMFGAAPISNDWFQPRGYSLTRKSARDFADAQKVYGTIPLDRSYLSNVEAKKGFLGNINNPRTLSMQFSRSLPPLNFPQETSTTSGTTSSAKPARIGVPPLLDPNNISPPQQTNIRDYPIKPLAQSTGVQLLAPQPTASNQSTQPQASNDQSVNIVANNSNSSNAANTGATNSSSSEQGSKSNKTAKSSATKPQSNVVQSNLIQRSPQLQEQSSTILERLLPGYNMGKRNPVPTSSQVNTGNAKLSDFAPSIRPSSSASTRVAQRPAPVQTSNNSVSPNIVGRLLPDYNIFQRNPVTAVPEITPKPVAKTVSQNSSGPGILQKLLPDYQFFPNRASSSNTKTGLNQEQIQEIERRKSNMPSSTLQQPNPRISNPKRSSLQPGFSLQFLSGNKQTGGELYLYQDGGLPRFQGTDASEVTLAPRSMSNPGQSAKTFGDTEFAMEPFDNSALVGARPQPMQLPTKTLQERAQEVDPDASMKTFGLNFRKDPLSVTQYGDIGYAGANLITNLKNRADQELAQAEMLNSETDPYNYFAQTYANPDEGININTYDMSRPYQSFMGQRQQFSPGVSSGFAKFGGMMKMGGTYEMDLSPEEVAYIQRMGGTIEYL